MQVRYSGGAVQDIIVAIDSEDFESTGANSYLMLIYGPNGGQPINMFELDTTYNLVSAIQFTPDGSKAMFISKKKNQSDGRIFIHNTADYTTKTEYWKSIWQQYTLDTSNQGSYIDNDLNIHFVFTTGNVGSEELHYDFSNPDNTASTFQDFNYKLSGAQGSTMSYDGLYSYIGAKHNALNRNVIFKAEAQDYNLEFIYAHTFNKGLEIDVLVSYRQDIASTPVTTIAFMKSGDNTIIARYKDDETSNPASPSYDFWKIAGVQPREARMIDHLNFHLIVVESSGGVVQNPSYGLCAITEAVGGNTLACTWSRIAHGSSFEETTSQRLHATISQEGGAYVLGAVKDNTFTTYQDASTCNGNAGEYVKLVNLETGGFINTRVAMHAFNTGFTSCINDNPTPPAYTITVDATSSFTAIYGDTTVIAAYPWVKVTSNQAENEELVMPNGSGSVQGTPFSLTTYSIRDNSNWCIATDVDYTINWAINDRTLYFGSALSESLETQTITSATCDPYTSEYTYISLDPAAQQAAISITPDTFLMTAAANSITLGTYEVAVQVSLPNGQCEQTTFNLNVLQHPCSILLPTISNTVFDAHYSVNTGNVVTLTPTVANPDNCQLIYSLITTDPQVSFDISTGIVTVSSASADGASAQAFYSYDITVEVVMTGNSDTQTFTVDFCNDYAPTLTVSNLEYEIAGNILTGSWTLTPTNDAGCELIWTKSGTDASDSVISNFDTTDGTFTFDSASAFDQQILDLALSVESVHSASTSSGAFTVKFIDPACYTYVPILTNTDLAKHLNLNVGDQQTYTPTVLNPDACHIYFQISTTDTYKSFNSDTGVVTVDTDEADGAASNHKYEYTITVVASTSTEAADPDSTKIFTADFCPDYNPIVTVVMTDVTFERNSGSQQTIAPTLTPPNSGACTMVFSKHGLDASNSLITNFDTTTGVFTVLTDVTSDKQLELTIKATATGSNTLFSTQDDFTLYITNSACLTYAPEIRNTEFASHFAVDSGNQNTITPQIINLNNCLVIYSLQTNDPYVSFDSATGIVTVSTTGESGLNFYEYTITVENSDGILSVPAAATKVFTADFCQSYFPIMTINDQTKMVNTGTVFSDAVTLNPTNDANCEMVYTLSGSDSGSAIITDFDTASSVIDFNSNIAQDQQQLYLTISAVGAHALTGTTPSSDSFQVLFVKANCQVFNAQPTTTSSTYTFSLTESTETITPGLDNPSNCAIVWSFSGDIIGVTQDTSTGIITVPTTTPQNINPRTIYIGAKAVSNVGDVASSVTVIVNYVTCFGASWTQSPDFTTNSITVSIFSDATQNFNVAAISDPSCGGIIYKLYECNLSGGNCAVANLDGLSLYDDGAIRRVVVTGADSTRALEGTRYFKVYATNGNLPDAPSDLLAITFVDPCRTETFSVVPNPPANLLSEVAANPVTGNFVVFSVNNFSGCGGYAYSFQYAAEDTNDVQPDIGTYLTVNENEQLSLQTFDSSLAGKTFIVQLIVQYEAADLQVNGPSLVSNSFMVEFAPCLSTGMTSTQPTTSTLNYYLNSGKQKLTFNDFVQTPSCGYEIIYTIQYNSLPSGITSLTAPLKVLDDNTLPTTLTKLEVESDNTNHVGTYDLKVRGYIEGFEDVAFATIDLIVIIQQGCLLPLQSEMDPTAEMVGQYLIGSGQGTFMTYIDEVLANNYLCTGNTYDLYLTTDGLNYSTLAQEQAKTVSERSFFVDVGTYNDVTATATVQTDDFVYTDQSVYLRIVVINSNSQSGITTANYDYEIMFVDPCIGASLTFDGLRASESIGTGEYREIPFKAATSSVNGCIIKYTLTDISGNSWTLLSLDNSNLQNPYIFGTGGAIDPALGYAQHDIQVTAELYDSQSLMLQDTAVQTMTIFFIDPNLCSANSIASVAGTAFVEYYVGSGDFSHTRTMSSVNGNCPATHTLYLTLQGSGNAYTKYSIANHPFVKSFDVYTGEMILNTDDFMTYPGLIYDARVVTADAFGNSAQQEFEIRFYDYCNQVSLSFPVGFEIQASDTINWNVGEYNSFAFTGDTAGQTCQIEYVITRSNGAQSIWTTSNADPLNRYFDAEITSENINNADFGVTTGINNLIITFFVYDGNGSNPRQGEVRAFQIDLCKCCFNQITVQPAADQTYYIADAMATYPITFTSSIALCDATFTYSAEVFDVTTNTWAATGTHDFISSFVTSTGTITVQTSDFAQYYDNPSKYYIIKIQAQDEQGNISSDQYRVTLVDKCLEAIFTTNPIVSESLIQYAYGGVAVNTQFTAPTISEIGCDIEYDLVVVNPSTGAQTVQPLWSFDNVASPPTFEASLIVANGYSSATDVYVRASILNVLGNEVLETTLSNVFQVQGVNLCQGNVQTLTRADYLYYIETGLQDIDTTYTRTSANCDYEFSLTIEGMDYTDGAFATTYPWIDNFNSVTGKIQITTTDYSLANLQTVYDATIVVTDQIGQTTSVDFDITLRDFCADATLSTGILAPVNQVYTVRTYKETSFTAPTLQNGFDCPIEYKLCLDVNCATEVTEFSISQTKFGANLQDSDVPYDDSGNVDVGDNFYYLVAYIKNSNDNQVIQTSVSSQFKIHVDHPCESNDVTVTWDDPHTENYAIKWDGVYDMFGYYTTSIADCKLEFTVNINGNGYSGTGHHGFIQSFTDQGGAPATIKVSVYTEDFDTLSGHTKTINLIAQDPYSTSANAYIQSANTQQIYFYDNCVGAYFTDSDPDNYRYYGVIIGDFINGNTMIYGNPVTWDYIPPSFPTEYQHCPYEITFHWNDQGTSLVSEFSYTVDYDNHQFTFINDYVKEEYDQLVYLTCKVYNQKSARIDANKQSLQWDQTAVEVIQLSCGIQKLFDQSILTYYIEDTDPYDFITTPITTTSNSNSGCTIEYFLEINGVQYVDASTFDYISSFNTATGTIYMNTGSLYAQYDTTDFSVTISGNVIENDYYLVSDSFTLKITDKCRTEVFSTAAIVADQTFELMASGSFTFTRPTAARGQCPIQCFFYIQYYDNDGVLQTQPATPYEISSSGYGNTISGYVDFDDEEYFTVTNNFKISCNLMNVNQDIVADTIETVFEIAIDNPCTYDTNVWYDQVLDDLTVQVELTTDSTSFVTHLSLVARSMNSDVEFCGDVEYRLVDASYNPISNDHILTLTQTGADAYTISLYTDDVTDVALSGSTFYLEAWFTDYPATNEYWSFDIFILCTVFDFETFTIDAQEYTVYTPGIQFSFADFIQYPACGHDLAGYQGIIIELDSDGNEIGSYPIPSRGITSFDAATRTFYVESTNPNDVGYYKINIYNSIALADQNPTYTEGFEIYYKVNNDCQYDEVSQTALSELLWEQKEYLHYIDQGETIAVTPAWQHTIEGCPQEWYYRVKDQDGIQIPTHLWEEDGLITFDYNTGAFLFTTTSTHYKHHDDIWTIQLVQASTYSIYDGREGNVEFTIQFRDICWDSVLERALIISQGIEVIVWSDTNSFVFESMVDVSDNDCGGYTHELEVVVGPKVTSEFNERYTMNCVSTTCTMTGVTDTFPDLEWVGLFYLRIKGTLGTKRIGLGRGTNGNGLYESIYSDTFTILGINPCETTTVLPGSLDYMYTTVLNPDDPVYQQFIEFQDQASVTHGITGFDKCGKKHYQIVNEDIQKINNNFIALYSIEDTIEGYSQFEIRVESGSESHVGTYTFGILSQLLNYPEAIQSVTWFQVEIGPCVVINFSASTEETIVYYQVSSNSAIIDYKISQYPCSYTPLTSIAQFSADPSDPTTTSFTIDAPPDFIYADNDQTLVRVTTYDSENVGEYWIRVLSYLDDEQETQASISFTLFVVEPEEDFIPPLNTAPFFAMPPQQTISVFFGEALNHTFGTLYDQEGDNPSVEFNCVFADYFVNFDDTTNSLIIDQGTTGRYDIGTYYCSLVVRDDNAEYPNQGIEEWVITLRILEKPEEEKQQVYKTESDYNIVALDSDATKKRVKGEPTFHIYSLTRSGLLTCTIEPPILVVQDISKLKGKVAIANNVQTETINGQTALLSTEVSSEGRKLQSELFKTDNGFEYLEIKPVIELYVVPSHEEKVNLNFTWEVKSMAADLIQIQLDFVLPPEVSARQEPDILFMTLWGSNYFQTQEGKRIKPGTTRSAPIAPQYTIETYQEVNHYAKVFDILIKLTIILALFLLTVWGRSRLTVWAFIDAMQMIFYLPLFAINIPAQANQLILRLFDNARLLLIPLNQIIQRKYAVMDKPFSINFYDAGYNSTFLWPNLSGVLIVLGIWFFCFLFCLVLDTLINKKSFNPKQFRRVSQNVFSRLILMLYLEILICCSLNLTNLTWIGTPRATVSTYLTLLLIIVLGFFTYLIVNLFWASCVFPAEIKEKYEKVFKKVRDRKYHFRFIGEQFYQYDQREILEKTPLFWMIQFTNFYDLYDGMINRVEKHYILCSGWHLLFLLRRILLVTVIFSLQSWPVLQILIMTTASLVSMGYLRARRPFEHSLAHIQMIINEWFILLLFANMLLFTDFVNMQAKQTFGSMFEVILCCFVIFNILAIVTEVILTWLTFQRKQQIQILRNEYVKRCAPEPNSESSEESEQVQLPIDIQVKNDTKQGVNALKEIEELSESRESDNLTDLTIERNFTNNNLDVSHDILVPVSTKQNENFLTKYAKSKLIKTDVTRKLSNVSNDADSEIKTSEKTSEKERQELQEANGYAQKAFLEYIQEAPELQKNNSNSANPEYTSQRSMYTEKEHDLDDDISARARQLTQPIDLGNVTSRYSQNSQQEPSSIEPPKRQNSVLSYSGQHQIQHKLSNNIFQMLKEKSRIADEQVKAQRMHSTLKDFKYSTQKLEHEPQSQNLVRSSSLDKHSNDPSQKSDMRQSAQSLKLVIKSQQSNLLQDEIQDKNKDNKSD